MENVNFALIGLTIGIWLGFIFGKFKRWHDDVPKPEQTQKTQPPRPPSGKLKPKAHTEQDAWAKEQDLN